MKRAKPALITDADRSQDDQLHSREVRYILMMAVRVVCLIVAAVLVGVRAPLLWLWIPICLVGMVFVPWLAVLLANDRPPKEQHRLGYRQRRRAATPTGPAQLPPAPPEPGPVSGPDQGPAWGPDQPPRPGTGRVIEHED